VIDAMQRLRDTDPVPRGVSTGWRATAEGAAARARAELAEPVPSLHRQPRRWVSLTVAAVMVLGLVTTILWVRSSDDPVAPSTATLVNRLAHGRWKEIDADPARDLENATTVWTGKELIVWGDRGFVASEGTAYDPARGRWRSLPPSPLGVRTGAVVLWLGDEMLVWGGGNIAESRLAPNTDGALYSPATDTWRRVAPAPFGPARADNGAITAVWTGRELVATNPLAPQGPAAAEYVPDDDTWVAVPDPPVSLAGKASLNAIWTGREVVYLVSSGTVADRAVLAFDPERHTWTTSSSPFASGAFGTAGLVRDGDTAAAIEWHATSAQVGAELRWARRQIPPKPWVPGREPFHHPSICAIEASPIPRGTAVFCDVHHLVGLDFVDGAWHPFPPPPGRLPPSVAWTGRELLALSGNRLLALMPSPR
jgi:hypothetical protein